MRSATARLPLAGFFQFADFALDEVALEHAEVGDEENSVEVIDLVAERARQQSLAAHLEFFSRGILRAHGHVLRPRDVSAKARDRKAAFFFALLSFGVNDLRVRADDLGFRVLADGHADHGAPPAD